MHLLLLCWDPCAFGRTVAKACLDTAREYRLVLTGTGPPWGPHLAPVTLYPLPLPRAFILNPFSSSLWLPASSWTEALLYTFLFELSLAILLFV